MFVVAVVGIIVALILWRHHPKVSLLTLAGLGLQLAVSLVFMLIFQVAARALTRVGALEGQSAYTVLYIVQDVFFSVVLILLVAAALAQRRTEPVSAIESLNSETSG
jgi:hypothetical protein